MVLSRVVQHSISVPLDWGGFGGWKSNSWLLSVNHMVSLNQSDTVKLWINYSRLIVLQTNSLGKLKKNLSSVILWFLRCAWGTCNADDRYPERLNGVGLILFPKPKTNREKCLRWINACGRPHRQLNVDRINKHKGACSKAFLNLNAVHMY